ncbi:hypothetical protein H0H93_013717 [Arthromyces matolae]|nr:hypothetical protein H0H93_013717 [Arthromyces matolae]
MPMRKFTLAPSLPPSPVIFFYDGSARITVDGTLILVHGSVIRCESEVLSDALMPFDTNNVEISLFGDRLEDVLFMLRVMYGKINVEGPMSAAEVAAGYRMFGQFKMHTCVDQLYRKIIHGLPADLAGFDRWWFDPGADILYERGAEIDLYSTLRLSGLHARYPVVLYRICLRLRSKEASYAKMVRSLSWGHLRGIDAWWGDSIFFMKNWASGYGPIQISILPIAERMTYVSQKELVYGN